MMQDCAAAFGLDIELDDDLALSHSLGHAWQCDRTPSVDYGADYWEKCRLREGNAISLALNTGRVEFVAKYYGPGRLLDVGIGSGEFIRARPATWGTDINPVALTWLQSVHLHDDRVEHFGAVSFWDVLEHMPYPAVMLARVQLHGFVFVSIPIFTTLYDIRASRHYRPGEHLHYWTAPGFVRWMRGQGFHLLESSDFETVAGRDSIQSFAFKRIAWPTK